MRLSALRSLFGAGGGALVAGSESILGLVVVGKARARERAAGTDSLRHCERKRSNPGPLAQRAGLLRFARNDDRLVRRLGRDTEPSREAPSSRPSPRTRGEGKKD